jgi:hypothetical protein
MFFVNSDALLILFDTIPKWNWTASLSRDVMFDISLIYASDHVRARHTATIS